VLFNQNNNNNDDDDFDDTEPFLPLSTGPTPLEPPPYGEYISWKEALTAVNRCAEPRA